MNDEEFNRDPFDPQSDLGDDDLVGDDEFATEEVSPDDEEGDFWDEEEE